MTAQFSIREADPQIVARLAHDLGLPRFIATTLVARGITTVRAAKRFLNPSLDRDWRNPLEIPGLAEVADGLINAIREKKRIVVFGDFDLDGISATTVLTRGLRALGACAFPFIPRRFEEGYGITAAIRARNQGLSNPKATKLHLPMQLFPVADLVSSYKLYMHLRARDAARQPAATIPSPEA